MALQRLLTDYRREFVRGDITAGLAVTALMVPHGMAYAELAGVPAVTGLYTTVAAVITYALIGPSRLLLVGPDSALAPLIAAAIALTASGSDPATAIAIAAVLALMSGALCLLAGLARLGSIAELLSKPVQLGYLNGLAIVMVTSQLAKLAGFSTDREMPIQQSIDFVSGVFEGAAEPIALMIGLLGVATIVVLARTLVWIPGVLVVVVASTALVAALGFADGTVDVVGALPAGFPAPAWPSIDAGSIPSLMLASVGLAWVTLSDTTALSRGFAGRTGEHIDPNDEIMALGVANLAAGAFGGFPVSASTTRTTTSAAAGGNTQLVGFISAALVLLLLIAGGDVVGYLPSAALAAVVVAAAIHLFDAGQVRWLYQVRRSEFLLCISATTAVVLLGVLNGLAVAVGLSIANFIRRVWRPYDAVLGRIDGRKGYHDRSRHPEARLVPGLVLFRFDAPLFFANSDHFERRIHALLSEADGSMRRLVIAAEPVTDIDTSAAAMLELLLRDLERAGVELAFAELKGPVKDRLRNYGLFDRIGADRFHSTIGSAVRSYRDDHEVEWTNWDER